MYPHPYTRGGGPRQVCERVRRSGRPQAALAPEARGNGSHCEFGFRRPPDLRCEIAESESAKQMYVLACAMLCLLACSLAACFLLYYTVC